LDTVAEGVDLGGTEPDKGEDGKVRKSTRLRKKPRKLNDYE